MTRNTAATRGRRYPLAAAACALVLLGAAAAPAAAHPAAPAPAHLFAAALPDPTTGARLPRLANPGVVQRLLQRAYPPRLWDAGVTGRTEVVVRVGADGRVQPGSARVRYASDDRFREAAVSVAARFRFTPGTVNGVAAPMEITVPIDWRLEP